MNFRYTATNQVIESSVNKSINAMTHRHQDFKNEGMKKTICFILFTAALLVACQPKKTYTNPMVVIHSFYGDIEVELYPEKAPKSVAAFLQYVDSGWYKNSFFYRVLSIDNQVTGSNPSELIQGGIYRSMVQPDSVPLIPHESTQLTGLSHVNGAVSLARLAPGTASTEFFICIGDQPRFDHGGKASDDGEGYAVFGQVVSGMENVLRIYARPEHKQLFIPPVGIINIERRL